LVFLTADLNCFFQPKSVDDDGSSDTDDELEEDEDSTSDGIVLFISFVIYIVIGSIAIAAYEPNMGVFEAIYFNFVTLTTIGLGDLVPQSDTYLVITLGLLYSWFGVDNDRHRDRSRHLEEVALLRTKDGERRQCASVVRRISMKALVKNLGDQFNVPIDEIDTLNLEQFVDNAIKVQEGELATLREERTPSKQKANAYVDKGWMKSNYWRAIESGTMHYVDDDDLVTLQSNRNYYSEF
ncbi:Ion channel, partial [Cooperia oncophora]